MAGLAGKVCAKADLATNDATKQILLWIAEKYERVAESVEQRSLDAEKPEGRFEADGLS